MPVYRWGLYLKPWLPMLGTAHTDARGSSAVAGWADRTPGVYPWPQSPLTWPLPRLILCSWGSLFSPIGNFPVPAHVPNAIIRSWLLFYGSNARVLKLQAQAAKPRALIVKWTYNGGSIVYHREHDLISQSEFKHRCFKASFEIQMPKCQHLGELGTQHGPFSLSGIRVNNDLWMKRA